MTAQETTLPAPRWKRKKSYIWLLAGFGLMHGLLMVYALAHPPGRMGLQLFIGFTLNVALLGWCYVDAEERMIPITRGLGFAMLFIAWIGVPWYFVRSRGFVGALKGWLGFGLFGIWVATLFAGAVVGAIVEAVLSR